ncbi:hypothetical protein H4R20_004407 [Coemansia guatemalensis]|uniref:SP-RING-type domain-containing protein n=1 Tax=Coemansia guatemalensis TaxID=2761395 RepID=A0A9W8LQJ2_9FUNG|nr:hypothetical protein H4R20_004407 [Coemansia guatemalensis]
MSQAYSQSQSGMGSQLQLQNRLQGLRNSIQNIQEIADDTTRACTIAALDLEEIGESEKVSEIDSSLRALIDAQHRLEVERALVTRLATQLDSETAEKEYMTGWQKNISKYEKMSEASKYGKNDMYREFRQQIWDVKHEGEPMPNLFEGEQGGDDSDEDLVIAGARVNYRCPVTATWLTDPVTSKVCKHSFSREAILDYIRGHGGKCACPVDGCSNRIRPQDLYADKVLERNVSRHLRQLESEETAAQYTMVQ